MTETSTPPVTQADILAGIITSQMAIVSLTYHLGKTEELKNDLERMRLRAEQDLSILVAGEFRTAPKERYPELFQSLERNITELSSILDYLQLRKST